MNLTQRAAMLQNALANFLNSPAAFLLPAGASHLLRELSGLVADLAHEVESMKGDI